jgi:hypothetical protein
MPMAGGPSRACHGEIWPIRLLLRHAWRGSRRCGSRSWRPEPGDAARGYRLGHCLLMITAGRLYRFKLIAWCLTWGLCDQLRRLVVLVDHATEDLAPSDRQVQRVGFQKWACTCDLG